MPQRAKIEGGSLFTLMSRPQKHSHPNSSEANLDSDTVPGHPDHTIGELDMLEPIVIAKSFYDLGLVPDICKRAEAVGYLTPTEIQREAIPLILEGADLIGIAQTGTGKTAAFMLPLLDALICSPPTKHKERPRILVLAPTRELAVQVHAATVSFAKGTGIRAVSIFGGVQQRAQEREIQNGCDAMIATPGRLLDLINQHVVSLANIEYLVLDEADRMLDMGFMPQIRRILSALPKDRQTLMFSATLSHEVEDLARRSLHESVMIQIGGKRKPAAGIAQKIYPVMKARKPELLLKLLKETERSSTLIFTRTKHDADRVTHVLQQAGIKATKLHSDLNQRDRTKALAEFRKGTFDTLVATDIAARGLDIDTISHVVNYEPPQTADDYVHRVGRTARAERKGEAYTLVSPEEEPMIREIEKRIGMQIERILDEEFAPPPPNTLSNSERRRLKGWSRR
ncbi:MAG: DEAD/DEAH box helicase [Candidatus Kapaibacterium sp.]